MEAAEAVEGLGRGRLNCEAIRHGARAHMQHAAPKSVSVSVSTSLELRSLRVRMQEGERRGRRRGRGRVRVAADGGLAAGQGRLVLRRLRT